MKSMDTNRVRLHILTPIHIGSGQQVDPFSYVLKDGRLLLIDLVSWMETFESKDELMQVVEGNDYQEVIAYISKRFASDEAVMDRIAIVSQKFVKDYFNATSGRQPRQQALLNLMLRTPARQRAIIPGSSIKGSIRTALGNVFVRQAGVTSFDGKSRKYDEKIFGGIKQDPMKYLKIGDVELPEGGTAILEAKEHAPGKKSLTPKGNFEASVSLCTTGKQVVLDLPFRLVSGKLRIHGEKVDKSSLVMALNNFYIPKFIDEYNKFYSHKAAADIQKALAPACHALANLNTSLALIRIGRFSHVECMTFDEVRRPIARKGWGKTRTLAEGLLPFGWALLEFTGLPEDEIRIKGLPSEVGGKDVQFMPHPVFRQKIFQAGQDSVPGKKPKEVQSQKPAKTESWEKVWVRWLPGKSEVEAILGDKKATGKGKDLVPDSLQKKVVKKKKAAQASLVKVEAVGNSWKIISIEA